MRLIFPVSILQLEREREGEGEREQLGTLKSLRLVLPVSVLHVERERERERERAAGYIEKHALAIPVFNTANREHKTEKNIMRY